MALKLDVSKAYDRIEWCFLEKVLNKLGFPVALVNLMMLCVTTVSYSFLLNGSQFGSLTPNRRIRQGDPFITVFVHLLCGSFYTDGGQGSRASQLQGNQNCSIGTYNFKLMLC